MRAQAQRAREPAHENLHASGRRHEELLLHDVVHISDLRYGVCATPAPASTTSRSYSPSTAARAHTAMGITWALSWLADAIIKLLEGASARTRVVVRRI